jgi:two-component system, OmpR family, sensor kinase
VSRLTGSDPVSHLPASAESLAVLVAVVRVLGTQLRGILSAIGRDIAPLRGQGGDIGETASSVGRHVTAASEIVSDQARLGACPLNEFPRHCDVADILRDVMKDEFARAARHDVRVSVDAPESAQDVVPQGALTVLLPVTRPAPARREWVPDLLRHAGRSSSAARWWPRLRNTGLV